MKNLSVKQLACVFVGWVIQRLGGYVEQIDPRDLSLFLLRLPELLDKEPRSWTTHPHGVGLGYGIRSYSRVRGPIPEELVGKPLPREYIESVTEPGWIVAWGGQWRYRIVPAQLTDGSDR